MNTILFFTGILLLLGIASSKFSARIGMPVLVLFLGVGMLAGSEGLGGIGFENYSLANSLGSMALALILFDGGLRTPMESVRACWRPALSLSTVGVLLTAVLTGLAATWVLDVPLLHGMLWAALSVRPMRRPFFPFFAPAALNFRPGLPRRLRWKAVRMIPWPSSSQSV